MSVDCAAMMAKCRNENVASDSIAYAMSVKEQCEQYGLEHGQITEEYFDELGVPARIHSYPC